MNEQSTKLSREGEAAPVATPSAPAFELDYDQAVDHFYEPLYRFAFGLTGSEEDAADLTQEAYQALLVKGGQIRDVRKLKGWLFTTLYRKFLGQRRHRTRFPEVQVETVEWELPVLESGTEETVDGNAAVAALQTLDEKYRAPLVLFYLQDLSYREVAAVLGVPIGTIMSRLARGKVLLRKRLAGECFGGSIRQEGNVSPIGSPDALAEVPGAPAHVMRWPFAGMATCH